MAHIAHLTSVHARNDTRIFLKQCRSLAAAGYDTTLVVADGLGEANVEGVRFVDVGRPQGRRDRMIGTTRRVLKQARKLDADLYQIHDPELLPAGLALRRSGKRVIFDAHEDLPAQILSKGYLPSYVRQPISLAASAFERLVCPRLSTVMTATPAIRDKFLRMGAKAFDINNFPILAELESQVAWTDKQREVCYVGGISAIRGIRQVVAAMAEIKSGARLNLVGTVAGAALKADIETSPGWPSVNELGQLSRTGVRDVLGRSIAGIVTFLPEPNHIESQPNKMFEYMSAGIPVIASDFPLWREIIDGNHCGICVDPLSPKAIAAAIDHLVDNPEIARQMGENGRRAVTERYNWGVEEKKLLDLYAKVLSER